MLALVKKPHIEMSLHGEHVAEIVDWIRKKYEVAILSEEPEEEFVSIESTEYWKEMEKKPRGQLACRCPLEGRADPSPACKQARYSAEHDQRL